MADPVTMMAVSMGISAIGGAVGAVGAKQKAGAEAATQWRQADIYSYQSGVSKVNQQIAKQNADYALKIGESQAQLSGLKARSMTGTARAAGGASGLDVNTGSKAAVVDTTKNIGEYEQSVIRSDAYKRAYGHDVEAMQHGAQSAIYGKSAESSAANAGAIKKAGDIAAITSILGGASSVSSKWSQASQAGIGYSGGSNSGGLFGGVESAGGVA